MMAVRILLKSVRDAACELADRLHLVACATCFLRRDLAIVLRPQTVLPPRQDHARRQALSDTGSSGLGMRRRTWMSPDIAGQWRSAHCIGDPALILGHDKIAG